MGATGAGKSSFIASATGLPVKIGHSLQSCKYFKIQMRSTTFLTSLKVLLSLKCGNTQLTMNL